MVFYSEGRGDGPLHLSAAAPVLCSQQPSRTDTPSPCMRPLWGRTGENVVCGTVNECVSRQNYVSSGCASGLHGIRSLCSILWRQIMRINVKLGICGLSPHIVTPVAPPIAPQRIMTFVHCKILNHNFAYAILH